MPIPGAAIAAYTERRTRRVTDAGLVSMIVGQSVGGSVPPPPPRHDFFDNFNRANGPLGSNWTYINDVGGLNCYEVFQYPAQSPCCANTGNGGIAYYNGWQNYSDVLINAIIYGGNLASAAIIALWARGTTASTGYFARVVPSTGAISIRTAAGALVSATVGACTAGDTFAFLLLGTTLKLTYTPVVGSPTVLTVVDATYTVGRCGVQTGAIGGAGWDDFRLTENPGAGGGGGGGGGNPPPPVAGWTTLTPSADSQIVYVDHVNGNNATGQVYTTAATGADPEHPTNSPAYYKTMQAAYDAGMRDGMPDWMVIKNGGAVITEKFPGWGKGGRLANERMVVTALSPDTLTRPTMTPAAADTLFFSQANTPKAHITIRHLICISDQDGVTTSPYGFVFRGLWADIQFEGLLIQKFWVGISVEGSAAYHIVDVDFTRVIIGESFRGAGQSGNPQGVYLDYVTGTIKYNDCYFDHCGWRRGIDSADDMPYPTRSHAIYHSVNCGPCELNNVTCIDTLSDGMQPRGGLTKFSGLGLRNPMFLIASKSVIVDRATILDSRNERTGADYERAHGIQITGDAGSTAGSSISNVVAAYRTADPNPINKAVISLDHGASGVTLNHITSYQWPGDTVTPVETSPDSTVPAQNNCHFNTAPSSNRDIAGFIVAVLGLSAGADAVNTYAALCVARQNRKDWDDNLHPLVPEAWVRSVFTI